MALQIPGYTVLPVSPSSLNGVMEAFDKGRGERRDQDALMALAKAGQAGQMPMPGPMGAVAPMAAPAGPQDALSRLVSASHAGTAVAGAAPSNTGTAALKQMGLTPAPSDPAFGSYIANARAAESGGNDAAANPNSSALGRYQFLESTWNGLAQQYPDLGLTPEGRLDPAQQERAMEVFTRDNAAALAAKGLAVNPGSLYAAHFLGAGGATGVLGQDPSSPLSAYVSPEVIQSNPNLQGMSVGDFVNWTNSKGGGSANSGYAPPRRDEGAVQGSKPYTFDPETMGTLLMSEATRPLALSLIEAQRGAEASQGRYVVEQGPNGSVFQRDTLTGETKVIMTPDQADAGGDETFFGNPVPFEDADGNIQFGQIGNKGTFKPIDLGANGGQFVSPTKTVNTETEQIVMDQFGNVLSRMPIQNAQAAQDTARGKGIGEAQAAGIVGAPQANANAETLLGQIDGVLNDQALGQAIGIGGILPAIPNTDQAGVVTKIEQLQGQAFLQAFESLKGAGQITEVEGTKATAAIARLNRVQNKEDFIEALGDLRTIVVAAQQRAQNKASIGAVPAPAATIPPAGVPPVTISGDAEFDALPSGTQFMGPDGQLRVKP